jgi:hypothetical protein
MQRARRSVSPSLVAVLAGAALTTGVLVAPSAANEAWGPGFNSCGSFNTSDYRINVSAKKVSCKRATAIQRELWLGPDSRKVIVNGGSGATGYIKLKRYPGWKCGSGAGAGACKKNKSVAAYDNENL